MVTHSEFLYTNAATGDKTFTINIFDICNGFLGKAIPFIQLGCALTSIICYKSNCVEPFFHKLINYLNTMFLTPLIELIEIFCLCITV